MSDQERVRPLYGFFGWAYDLVVPRPAGPAIADVASLFAHSGVIPGMSVVDAGCGTGRYAEALAEKGYRVTGVDSSAALLRCAADRAGRATFARADLLGWRPPRPVSGVLCRGVLNDIVPGDRARVFAAFAGWLRSGGTLIADVRDWVLTAARYADSATHEHRVEREDDRLWFSSETELDSRERRMLVREFYSGRSGGVEFEGSYDFVMYCWTEAELSVATETAGLRISGIDRAADRMVLVARR